MKLRTYNLTILSLATLGLLGFLISGNKLFLAALIIYGIWFIVNLAEHFINKKSNNKPIKMMKE